MLRISILFLLITITSGCATTESSPKVVKLNEESYQLLKQKKNLTQGEYMKVKMYEAGILCRSEAPTGSKIAVRKCTSKAQRLARKQSDEMYLNNAIRNDSRGVN